MKIIRPGYFSCLKSFLNKFCLAGLFFIFSPLVSAAYETNMTRGVTEISREVHNIHMTIFWICVVIGIIVFSVMFYSIIYHRKSRGAVAAHFHEHPMVEIIWTVIPCLILIGMAIPATRLLIKMNDTKDSYLSIKVTGHQWRWEYEYLGKGLRFISNNATPQIEIQNRALKGEHYLESVDKPLVLPIGKKIRFLTTSSDVIHSWWMPAFGIKKDAIPGFINETWALIEKPGTYRSHCAELCGVNHGFMPIVVEAKTEEEFEAWLQNQLAPPEPATPAVPAITAPTENTPTPKVKPTTPTPTTSTATTPAATTPATTTPTPSHPNQTTPPASNRTNP